MRKFIFCICTLVCLLFTGCSSSNKNVSPNQINVTLTNNVSEKVAQVVLSCGVGSEEKSYATFVGKDGKWLEKGDHVITLTRDNLGVKDAGNFYLHFVVTDVNGEVFDMGTTHFAAQYGANYPFVLKEQAGQFVIGTASSTMDWRKLADGLTEAQMTVVGRQGEAMLTQMTDTGIWIFYDRTPQQLAGLAKFPVAIPDWRSAELEWDFVDLDGNGYSDPTVWMRWPDGTTACLLWIWNGDKGLTYNLEFSWLPGEVPGQG